MRRMLSLYLPNWVMEQCAPQKLHARQPFVWVWSLQQKPRVIAGNWAAVTAGVRSGQALADAAALCPGLGSSPFEARHLSALFRPLLRFSQHYTPLASLQPLYDDPAAWRGDLGLFLDVSGAERYFGGEPALLQRLLQDMTAQGFSARLALTSNTAASWALSRYGPDPVQHIPAEQAVMPFLRDLPAAALRLPAATLADLDRLGLRSVAQVMQQPRSGLLARFGEGLLRRLDESAGIIDSPLSPAPLSERFAARAVLPEPIISHDSMQALLDQLLQQLCAKLEARTQAARLLILSLRRVDGTELSLEARAAQASRAPKVWARLYAPLLEDKDFGLGIEAVTLMAGHTQPQTAANGQGHLLGAQPQQSGKLSHALDRIAQRLGSDRVLRWQHSGQPLPEQAFTAIAWGQARPRCSGDGKQWERAKLRPLRLFSAPEPAELNGKTLHWRKVSWRVVRREGPERIMPEWWHGPQVKLDQARDYYRVHLESGRRLWLYAEANPMQAAKQTPHVFVHGEF